MEITGTEPNVGGGATTTMTANTAAKPSIVTAAAHGLETGDHVTIAGSNSTVEAVESRARVGASGDGARVTEDTPHKGQS